MDETSYEALRPRVWGPAIALAAIALGVGMGGAIGTTWGFGAALIWSAILGLTALILAFIAAFVLKIVRDGYDVGGGR